MNPDPDKEHIARLWQSVFRPAADVTAITIPGFDKPAEFSFENAIALAWICHAIYIPNTRRRMAFLTRAGLREQQFHGMQQLHWSLITPECAPGCAIVAFRGTCDLRHWLFNFHTLLTTWPGGGKVHGGFARAYQKIASPLRETLAEMPFPSLCFTGHSLGGALALLAATEHPAEAVYTFGCPRPGNPAFAERAEKIPIYRVVHDQDVVTTIPYEIEFLHDLAYKHVGCPVHIRPDEVLTIGREELLPHSLATWRQTLHAVLEGDHRGEPPPALQDHAPSLYVKTLQETRALQQTTNV